MPDEIKGIIKKINYNGDTYIVGVQTEATTSEAGLLSPTDKAKIDNMAVSEITGTSPINASTSNSITTISHNNSGVTAGSKGDTTAQAPSFGETFKVTSGTVNATGHMTAFAEHTVTIPSSVASTTTAGLMSATDKAKLDSIAEGAQANSVTGVKGNSESSYRTGNVNITKANIGLGNVENKSSATIRGEITSANVTTALGYTPATQNTATTTSDGLLSSTDKQKIDNLTVFSITGTSPIDANTDDGVATISHADSGVTASTYGVTATTALTPGFGSTFDVPGFAVNAKGHITTAGSHTVKIPNTAASTTAAGLMSKDDKSKLDSIADNATNTTITGTSPIVASASTGAVTISHATSGVTANTYGVTATSALTPAFGATFSVPGIQVNATGHITAAGAHTVKIPDTLASSSAPGLMSATDKGNFDSGLTIAGNTLAIGGTITADALRTSLGLSSAMHFIGIATVAITDDSTTNPAISGYDFGTNGVNATPGDVVIDKDSSYEYVWTGIKWERLGPDGSYALADHTHATATTGAHGFMSKEDKSKLDNMLVSSITGTAPISASTTNGVATISHNTSGVTANTYGITATSAVEPAFGATFSVPGFTVNNTGHITAAGAHTVKIPATIASTDGPGLMSKTDKDRLDNMADNATNTTIAATSPIIASASTGAVTITHYTAGPSITATTTKGQNGDLSVSNPADNASFKFGDTFKSVYLSVDKYGHTTNLTESTVQIPNYTASSTYDGLMSFTDKDRFDNLDDEYIQKSVLAHANSLIYASAANTPAELEAFKVSGRIAWLMSGVEYGTEGTNPGTLQWIVPDSVDVITEVTFTPNIPTDTSYANGILTINVGEPASIITGTVPVLSVVSKDSSGNSFHIATDTIIK